MSAHAPSTRLELSARRGVYEHRNAEAHVVVLNPGRKAEFFLGTATAYQGGLNAVTLTDLIITLPDQHPGRRIAVELAATRPGDGAIPIGITALEACRRQTPGSDLARACAK